MSPPECVTVMTKFSLLVCHSSSCTLDTSVGESMSEVRVLEESAVSVSICDVGSGAGVVNSSSTTSVIVSSMRISSAVEGGSELDMGVPMTTEVEAEVEVETEIEVEAEAEIEVEAEVEAAAAATRADVTAATTDEATVVRSDTEAVRAPFSIASTTFSAALVEEEGMKRVHQNAMRRLLSTRRCLRMKRTTRMKNSSAARISMRSSQSDFSSAVMRCFEVTIKPSKTS